MIPIIVNTETPVTCLHCGLWVERGYGIRWVHARSGREECPATYAAPVFSDDPTYRDPTDFYVYQ